MSTTETSSKDEKAKIAKGLQVRTFEREIAADEKKGTPKIPFNSDKIVLPWARSGKDIKGEDAEGAVPTSAQVIEYCKSKGWPLECQYDVKGNETSPSVCSLLIMGINSYNNITARADAQNTDEQVWEKMIQLYMKKGKTREEALTKIRAMAAL